MRYYITPKYLGVLNVPWNLELLSIHSNCKIKLPPSSKFGVTDATTVPGVFIDALFDPDDAAEVAKLNEETEKLWLKVAEWKAYSCEGFEAVKVELDEMRDDMEKLQVRTIVSEKRSNSSLPAVCLHQTELLPF